LRWASLANERWHLRLLNINEFNHMASFIRQLETAKLEYHDFTEAIKQAHGDDYHNYHFSNELSLINKIVLGTSTGQFRKDNDVKGHSIRPYLDREQLDGVIKLQRFDMGLIITEPDYYERKRILTDYYARIKPVRLFCNRRRQNSIVPTPRFAAK